MNYHLLCMQPDFCNTPFTKPMCFLGPSVSLQYLELVLLKDGTMQLKVFREDYVARMKELIAWKLCTTVNSDDPPFFGGYINENFVFWMEELDLSEEELRQLAYNSVEASFQSKEQKALYMTAVQGCQPQA